MCYTVFINKTDGDNIITLTEKTLRNIITARRILVIGATHLLTIDKGNIGIKQGSQEQSCGLSGMRLVNLNMLAKPYCTHTPPTPIFLLDSVPGRVIIVQGGKMSADTWVTLVQQFVPLSVCQSIGLLLCLDEIGVVI